MTKHTADTGDQSEEPVRVVLHLSIGYAGAEHEDEFKIPRAEWDVMSEDERMKVIDDALENHAANYVDIWADVES